MSMKFIPVSEFSKVYNANLEWQDKLSALSQMNRLNTLFSVKRAGSGHLGSSFSSMDIVVFLYYHYLNLKTVGIDSPERDIYFSSKGHDAPGQYAVLYSLGFIPETQFLSLRRYGGLEGHPDVETPGVEANTGSLGMGISKARGMSFAKNYQKRSGKIIVMTGDGEFQEGQNFEALQSTVHQQRNDLIVVMDHNKLQSDRLVERINSLKSIESKISSFGWAVLRCDGHNFQQLHQTFQEMEKIKDRPKFLICDTIKGRGVSFMEHPFALEQNLGYYPWHAGAPDDKSYVEAWSELFESIREKFAAYQLGELQVEEPIAEKRSPTLVSKASSEFIAEAYGKALVELAEEEENFFVLDADLSLDCRIRNFEEKFPHRFIEMGIAEQDMVSMASGMALQGLLPICHSFANFLAARANEQIYNALSEKHKIIFACHYGGLLPGGPGKSHQSVRDISLFGAFPNITILQPATAAEMREVVRYAILSSTESCMIRLNIGPSPKNLQLPNHYRLTPGCGCVLEEGAERALFTYGPVMLNEALLAREQLLENGLTLKVIHMPWLNRFDKAWLKTVLSNIKEIYVLEDHSPVGGLGDHLFSFLNEHELLESKKITKFGVEGYPKCGSPAEVLRAHHLDGASLVKRILEKSPTLRHEITI